MCANNHRHPKLFQQLYRPDIRLEKREINTMATTGAIKIAGYLEKKGKRIMSTWKRYWFVLEGRLLLYYKSQAEVTNLCPCRGSINMGLATGVRPLISRTHGPTGPFMFEIVTHTNNTVLLRTKDRQTQEQWLQALLDALSQPNVASPVNLSQFRYSMDSLIPVNINVGSFKRQNTLPYQPNGNVIIRRESFLSRIRRIGGYTRSLETVLKDSPIDEIKPLQLGRKRQEISELHNEKQNSDKDDEEENDIYDELPNGNLNENEILENEECMRICEQNDNANNSVIDENKNCCLVVENNDYEPTKLGKITVKPSMDETVSEHPELPSAFYEDELDYYVTYGELQSQRIAMQPKSETSSEVEYNEVPETGLEPVLPPRRDDRLSVSDDRNSDNSDTQEAKKKKKLNLNFSFLHKDRTEKQRCPTKRRMSFLQKLLGHNKKKAQQIEVVDDADYDYVEFESIEKPSNDDEQANENSPVIEPKKLTKGLQMLKQDTLLELKQKLSSKAAVTDDMEEIYESVTDEPPGQTTVTEALIHNTEITETEDLEECPGLPPRRGTRARPRSPWHDVPTNNTRFSKPHSHHENIVSPHQYNVDMMPLYCPTTDTNNIPIETTLNKDITPKLSPKLNTKDVSTDTSILYSKVKKGNKNRDGNKSVEVSPNHSELMTTKLRSESIGSGKDQSELSVRELINKFDTCESCLNVGNISICKIQVAKRKINDGEVVLRKDKCDSCLSYDKNVGNVIGVDTLSRNSEDLSRLLNELSKITSAPLLQPGVTSSLTQMESEAANTSKSTKSCGPLTDEEWLAIAPIRRRRHSEPDYDIPRSHRSLNICPPLPPKQNQQVENIPATRFFGPVLSNITPQIVRDSIEPPSLAWTVSITPDSLEVVDHMKNQNNVKALKNQFDELDRSMGNESIQLSKTLVTIEEKSLEDDHMTNNDICGDSNKNMQLISGKFFDSLEQSTIF